MRPVKKIAPAPVDGEDDGLELGLVVHDRDQHPWVYIGNVPSTASSKMHYFAMSVPVKKGTKPWEQRFVAVQRQTCVRRFPDLADHWPDKDR